MHVEAQVQVKEGRSPLSSTLAFRIRDEYRGNQRVGGLDGFGHVFGLSKLLHVLRGIVGESCIACRVPGVELDAFGPFQILHGKGEGETQDGQGMGDILLGNRIHARSVPK